MPFPPFNKSSDVEVIGTFNADDTFLAERRGTTSAGTRRKPRYSVEVRSEPLLFALDDVMLGATVTDAYAELIRKQGEAIQETASPATLKKRESAARSYAAGKPSSRYAGGRIGPMAPNQSDKLFSDSGRLWKSIRVAQNRTDNTFTINVAANRLNPTLFGKGFDAMLKRLFELVPAFDPKKAREAPELNEAISTAMGEMVVKAKDRAHAELLRKKAQLRKAKLEALGAFVPGSVMKVIKALL
jgi:hypothetical protein